MRFLAPLLLSASFLSSALAQDFESAEVPKQKLGYQVCTNTIRINMIGANRC
jgi:hypothetical protein